MAPKDDKFFPLPGTEAFAQLPEEEQAWVGWVRVWYVRGSTLGSPSVAMNDPIMDEFRAHPRKHLPKLLHYFATSPRLFHRALEKLTGHQVQGKTWEDLERGWTAFLPGYLAAAAAE